MEAEAVLFLAALPQKPAASASLVTQTIKLNSWPKPLLVTWRS